MYTEEILNSQFSGIVDISISWNVDELLLNYYVQAH